MRRSTTKLGSLLTMTVVGAAAYGAVARADDTPLMSELKGTAVGDGMADLGLSLNGWVEVAGVASNNQNLLPEGFNYRGRNIGLQQSWIRFERPLEGDTSVGFKIDWIAPGLDYRFTIARGLLDQQLADDEGQPNRYGFDPVQFYTEVKLSESTSFTIGRFFAPYGKESIEGWSTPFVSRSYSFIYNPFTQTGVLAKTALTPTITLQGAVTAGNDVFLDDESNVSGDLGVTYTSSDQATKLVFLAIVGESRFDTDHNFNNPSIVDLVIDQQLTEDITYSLEGIFGFERRVPDVGTATWLGVAQYLRYKVVTDVDLLGRVEAFTDQDGNRTGVAGTYWAETVGVQYHPVAWLALRPEARCDHHTEGAAFGAAADQFSVTFDALARW